jgi:hypothetical protein
MPVDYSRGVDNEALSHCAFWLPAPDFGVVRETYPSERGMYVRTACVIKPVPGLYGDDATYLYIIASIANKPNDQTIVMRRNLTTNGEFEVHSDSRAVVRQDYTKNANWPHLIGEWEPVEASGAIPGWVLTSPMWERPAMDVDCLRETPAPMWPHARTLFSDNYLKAHGLKSRDQIHPRFMALCVPDFKQIGVMFAEYPWDWSNFELIGFPVPTITPVTTIGYRSLDMDALPWRVQFASNDPWLNGALLPKIGDRVDLSKMKPSDFPPVNQKPDPNANPSADQCVFELEMEAVA